MNNRQQSIIVYHHLLPILATLCYLLSHSHSQTISTTTVLSFPVSTPPHTYSFSLKYLDLLQVTQVCSQGSIDLDLILYYKNDTVGSYSKVVTSDNSAYCSQNFTYRVRNQGAHFLYIYAYRFSSTWASYSISLKVNGTQFNSFSGTFFKSHQYGQSSSFSVPSIQNCTIYRITYTPASTKTSLYLCSPSQPNTNFIIQSFTTSNGVFLDIFNITQIGRWAIGVQNSTFVDVWDYVDGGAVIVEVVKLECGYYCKRKYNDSQFGWQEGTGCVGVGGGGSSNGNNGGTGNNTNNNTSNNNTNNTGNNTNNNNTNTNNGTNGTNGTNNGTNTTNPTNKTNGTTNNNKNNNISVVPPPNPGLGVGISLGCAILICIIVGVVVYHKRRQKFMAFFQPIRNIIAFFKPADVHPADAPVPDDIGAAGGGPGGARAQDLSISQLQRRDPTYCMIDLMVGGTHKLTLPCQCRQKYMYHLPCITQWVTRSGNCPTCKKVITLAAIIPG